MQAPSQGDYVKVYFTLFERFEQEQVPRVPVIVIGRDMSEDDMIFVLEMGADLCVAEVFQPKVFVARVQVLLRREALRSAAES
jgi:DNA-binding response OmpR family regulator